MEHSKNKRIPANTWSLIRTAFVAGDKVAYLANKFGVSIPAIYHKCREERWLLRQRTAQQAVEARIEEEKEKTISDMFVQAGLPKQERVKLLVEGATKPDKLLFEGEGDQKICTPVPDYGMRLQYLKEIHALTGDYAPKKIDNTSDGKPLQISNYNTLNLVELKAILLNRLNGMAGNEISNNSDDTQCIPPAENDNV